MSKNFHKKLIALLFFLAGISAAVNAQTIDTVFINADSIIDKAITLSDVWRYHPGDDSFWASPNFDDSDWDTLRTNFRIDEIGKNVWIGIGWFRKKIVIDSSLTNSLLGLTLNHFGASEIYLNGKLIHGFGKVSSFETEEEIYHPRNIPFAVELDSNLVYTLAVRYSNHISISEDFLFKDWFENAGFRVRISELDGYIKRTVENERISFAVNIGISGLFLSLAILYFLLFLFYSRKKENIYYSFFTLFIALVFAQSVMQRFVYTNITHQVIFNIIGLSSIVLIFAAYLGFLYSIFYKNMPKIFWIIVIIGISIIASVFINAVEDITNYALIGFILITTVEGLRIIILSIKRNKDNAWVIGAGVIVFVLFIITLFVISLLGIGSINSLLGIILFFVGLLSLPASMSIYLARDIALTNKNLTLQLQNVQNLSKKELEQQLRAQKAEAENERKTKELDEARQLQLSMLPKELPQLPHLDIAVYMQTATEVGGDYYDFHIGLDGTLTVVIGDATGHGMKAGTMVTAAKSIFNSYVNNPDIIFTFGEFNRVIKGMQLPSMSMCLSLLKIKGNNLTMSAAGMPHALLYRSENKKVEEIILKGMPLGAVKDFPYQLKTTQLKSGDTLLLLSDGLPELFDSEKEMFGYDRVTTEYEKVASNNAKAIIEHLKNVGTEWLNGNDPDDDITFVVIKVK